MNINLRREEGNASFAKAATYYLICQLLVRGMSFITTPIFSRLMSKGEYGQFSNFLAWESLLFPLVTLDLRITINKSKYDYPNDNDSYLSSIVTASIISTFLAWIVTELLHDSMVQLMHMNMNYIRMLFLYMLFYIAFDYQQLQLNIYRKYKIYVVYSLLVSASSLLLSVFLVTIFSNKFSGRVIGIVAPEIIVGGFILLSVYRRSHRIKWMYMAKGIAMSAPLILSTMSTTVLSSSDRIIITKYLGEDETAMYTIAYTVSSISAILWNAINQALSPWMYDNMANKNFEKIKVYSNRIVDFYSVIICGLIVFAPSVLWILGGTKYIEAIDAMPPVILAMACQFFYVFYFYIEYFNGETATVSLGTMIAAVLNLILNLLFIPQYGYVAAAYTTLVGYAVMLLYHFLIVKYKLKSDWMFDNAHFAAVGVYVVIVQILSFQTYHRIYFRIAISIIYCVFSALFALKNKSFLLNVLKSVVSRRKKSS